MSNILAKTNIFVKFFSEESFNFEIFNNNFVINITVQPYIHILLRTTQRRIIYQY